MNGHCYDNTLLDNHCCGGGKNGLSEFEIRGRGVKDYQAQFFLGKEHFRAPNARKVFKREQDATQELLPVTVWYYYFLNLELGYDLDLQMILTKLT